METKAEFLIALNTCNAASGVMYNKLGLVCKRFAREMKNIHEDIADEELAIYYEHGIKEADAYKHETYPNGAKGAIIVKADKQKQFNTEMKALKNQKLSKAQLAQIAKFEKIEVDYKVLGTLDPALFDVLNGVIFHVTDEVYLAATEKLASENK
jgi:hypothetical protein